MKKHPRLQKLTINRETLQLLAAPESARVAAASGFNTCNISCLPTCIEGTSCVQCPG
jgi:hypothetical protein